MANYTLAGPASVIYNGNAYTTNKTVKYTVNNLNQELAENWSLDNATIINLVPLKITIGFLDSPTFDATSFVGNQNGELVLLLANGKTASFPNVVVGNVGEISAAEGVCEIEFLTYTPAVVA